MGSAPIRWAEPLHPAWPCDGGAYTSIEGIGFCNVQLYRNVDPNTAEVLKQVFWVFMRLHGRQSYGQDDASFAHPHIHRLIPLTASCCPCPRTFLESRVVPGNWVGDAGHARPRRCRGGDPCYQSCADYRALGVSVLMQGSMHEFVDGPADNPLASSCCCCCSQFAG